MLNHWENYIAGIKQSLDFILSVFKKFNLVKKQKESSIDFINDDYSNILELKLIFNDINQFRNLITTRNAFTHNFFMSYQKESTLYYLIKSQGSYEENTNKSYDIFEEAKDLFSKFIPLVGTYLLVMFKRQEFYNLIAKDLSLSESELLLLNKYYDEPKNDFFFKICFLDTSNKFELKRINTQMKESFIKLLNQYPPNITSFFKIVPPLN